MAGGGTLYAWDLQVETAGESSAAVRSDRGSGKMVVDGGSYLSTGVGSPVIYSTADITANFCSVALEIKIKEVGDRLARMAQTVTLPPWNKPWKEMWFGTPSASWIFT